MSLFSNRRTGPLTSLAPDPKPRVSKIKKQTRDYKPVVTSQVPVKRKASATPIIINPAGGRAYQMSDKTEFVTGMKGGMLRQGGKGKPERIYESEEDRGKRLIALIPKVGAEFAAKTTLSIRIEDGLRSMSHLMAAALADHVRGQPWAAKFYEQVCVRADDPLEIIAAYWTMKGKKGFLPSAMRKGFARFFNRLDYYRIAKYAGGNRSVRLVDLVNLCHPVPNDRNRQALADLVNGTIKNTDTWEARLSEAGNTGKSKGHVWDDMVLEGKLGALGLLRNLRNIGQHCSDGVARRAARQLSDQESIKRSGILPMQYLKAYEVINETGMKQKEVFKAAIDDAVEMAVGNVPSLGRRVLVVIDESGSMGKQERDNASLFAAVMLKANPTAEVMFFATTARYAQFDRRLPLLELTEVIRGSFQRGATDFTQIFKTANRAYDAMVILSDGEGWMSGGAPVGAHAQYKAQYGCNPTIFSFDLAGDGSLMFREDGIILLAGFSFHVFKLLNLLNQERTKLVDVIDRIQIGQPLNRADDEDDE